MILIMVIVIMVIFIFMFFIFMILIVMIFFITVDDTAMIMMRVVGIIKYQIASLGHGERSHEAVLVLEVLFIVFPGAIVRVIIVIHCWPMFWSSPPFSDNPRSRHTKFWAGPPRLIHVTNSSMGIEGIDRGDIIFVKTILGCPVIHAGVLWVSLVFWVLTLVLPLQAARYSWVIVGPRMLGLHKCFLLLFTMKTLGHQVGPPPGRQYVATT